VRSSVSHAVKAFCAAVVVGGLACAVTAGPASAAPARNPFAGLTADQIASKAVADFKSASSVHVNGRVSESGITESFSMSLTQKGVAGSIQVGGEGAEGMVAIGSTVWLRPDKQMWESYGYTGSRLAKVLGKWLKVTDDTSGPNPPADIAGFAASVGFPVTGLAEGKTASVSGHLGLELVGKKATSYYVSVSAKPEVLSIDRAGVSVTFSAYNAHVTITAPPASDVVTPGGI
jgi:hypothetical protein